MGAKSSNAMQFAIVFLPLKQGPLYQRYNQFFQILRFFPFRPMVYMVYR